MPPDAPLLVAGEQLRLGLLRRFTLHLSRGQPHLHGYSRGLLDGDIAVAEANTFPRPGDIVVAVVDNQVTVKYLRMDPSGAWFREPANAAYGVIRPEGSLEVLGVVVGSFRRYRR